MTGGERTASQVRAFRLAHDRWGLYMPHSLMTTDDARLKKLRLRAWRRGFKEADLILGPFADKHVSAFGEAELDWFERLLEQPDQDVYAWILERTPTPPELDGPLMRLLKAFRDEAHKISGPGGSLHG
jgi:antitoxin CptB